MVEEDVLFESNQDMSDEWILYYYPRFPGRAEFVRLVFVEAGVPWKECGLDGPSVWKLICGGEMPGYPHFAPPVLQKGDLQISQTSVICKYLGEQFGLVPDSVEDRIHAEQISLSCHDYIAEGRLSFHGIHPQGPYLSQKEATQPYIDRFVSERLPRWMKYFERVLSNNQEGKGFLYGDKLSYADLALLHIVRATEAQFPEAFKAADYMQNLKDFKLRMEARKNIADYLRSDKWLGFSGDSMM
ncbi:hypothetical protein DPMN_194557 [Dreissena polymorpha]|uniref:Glutathione transferase n=3 Tax=Dreissena polymorpha TaxID=45954 RepID=A0A9D3Y6D8_DREPO|nr:hypothetical protein DPMN_194557 [Dreissena polymorpha]